MAKWKKRVAGWLGVVVLSLCIPIAIDQGLFRYNAYILPVFGILAAVLCLGLLITSRPSQHRIRILHARFSKTPLAHALIVGGCMGTLILLMVLGGWLAIRSSKSHVATLRKQDALLVATLHELAAPVKPPAKTDLIKPEQLSPQTDIKSSPSSPRVKGPATHMPPASPQITNNCPNGICISGGPVSNPTVNNYGDPEPTFTIIETAVNNQPDGDAFKTQFHLVIDSKHAIPNPRLTVSAPTIKKMNAGPERTGPVVIGWSGVRDGSAFTNLPNAHGTYLVTVICASPEKSFDVQYDPQYK